MSNNNPSNLQNDLNIPEIVNGFLEVQRNQSENDKLKLQNEAERTFLMHKLALKQLDAKENLLLKKPSEERKNILLVGIFLFLFIVLIIGFCIYCIEKGYIEIVIKVGSYIGTFLISFLGGKYYGNTLKNRRNSSNDGE
jgi:hypothetical protein